jgi:hypothetical protein
MPRVGLFGVEFMPGPPASTDRLDEEKKALSEWWALDEIKIANTTSPDQEGSIYEVLKAGGYFVSRNLCSDLVGLVSVNADLVILPTATLWTLAGRMTYRLPPPLGGWVLMNLDLARAGRIVFPADVGILLLEWSLYGGVKVGVSALGRRARVVTATRVVIHRRNCWRRRLDQFGNCFAKHATNVNRNRVT